MAIILRPTGKPGLRPLRRPKGSIAKGLKRAELLDLMTALEEERLLAVGRWGDIPGLGNHDDSADVDGGSRIGLLAAVGRAYERLMEGSFNVCAHCGHLIGLERLRIVPHADTCVPCAILFKDDPRTPAP